jgi:predicted ester cyclase
MKSRYDHDKSFNPDTSSRKNDEQRSKIKNLDTVSNSEDQITRTLVQKYYSDIWNRGDVKQTRLVCSKRIRINGPGGMERLGLKGFSDLVSSIRSELDQFHAEILTLVVEKNKAFCKVHFTAIHKGEFLGYPPTGKSIEWTGAIEITCKDGYIVKVWELLDMEHLEKQLLGN